MGVDVDGDEEGEDDGDEVDDGSLEDSTEVCVDSEEDEVVRVGVVRTTG